VFWDDRQGCQVYEDRPLQCRTYPFWRANVHSAENWQAEARACPGIGEGPLHSAEEVARTASDDGIPAERTRGRLKAAR
jgi:Fe-S-cluster containining protein